MEKYYLLRIKKPHRVFAVGDILLGVISDGQAKRMICTGYSNRLKRMVRNYSIRYQNRDYWNNYSENKVNGGGHAKIVGEIKGPESLGELFWTWSKEPHELSQCKSTGEFLRRLSSSVGNLPQSLMADTDQAQVLTN